MKKLATILLAMFLFSAGAEAQWYLFPGGRATQAGEEQSSASESTAPRHDPTQEQEPEYKGNGWSFMNAFPGKASSVNVLLALPVNAGSQTPNTNFLEMYSGALIALRDLGNEGIRIRLKFVDTGSGKLTAADIQESDVIIGPVSYDEILNALPACGDQKMLVSPLDPKTAVLAGSSNVIQAPSSWTSQIDELVDWVQEELMPGDELIVVQDPSKDGQGEQSQYLISRMHGKVLKFRIVKSISDISFNEGTTYRILMASDSDSFLTGTTRAAAIEAARNRDIVLYSTSRIRSTIGSNVNDLHNTRTRLTAAYHIDYDSPKVKDFILAYRALFKSEPGSFAFQGYDTVHYFVTMCAEYGRKWYRRLPEYQERGLQSDFRFDRRESNGKLNVAVRRIIYNSDLTTTLVQD